MRMGSRDRCAVAPSAALIASLLALLSASAAEAQPASVEELVSAVVRINTHITPDGRTLIVGESFGARLTAFDIAEDGSLSNRRVWAQLEKAMPDGICLDAENAISFRQ